MQNMRLFPIEQDCHVCDDFIVEGKQSVYCYEGYVLPKSWRGGDSVQWDQDSEQKGAGFPVCHHCVTFVRTIIVPTPLGVIRKLSRAIRIKSST